MLYFRLSVTLFLLLLFVSSSPGEEGGSSPIRFEEVAASAGVDFFLDNHPTERKHMIETMAGGVATLDYNNDGRTDIFFTNGAELPSLQKTGPRFWNRLYRNDGDWKFTDVTEEAGVAGRGYAQGVAVADYDNDGDQDIFVAGVFENQLLQNQGDGSFLDVTKSAGIAEGQWAVAAGWFDYNNDGVLDLMVIHYADWNLEFDRYCGDRDRDLRVYCHPQYFKAIPNFLYRGNGDGTFTDVSKSSGILAFEGRGMSVAFADYDGNGYTDAFVTNDALHDFLFRNNGDGTFEEDALLAGVALPDMGKPISSMGADFRDYDNDGLPDIFLTALEGETFPLFENDGSGMFRDVTFASKIGPQVNALSGWSLGFADFDNDGWKDLFTANSHANDIIFKFQNTDYKMRNAILRNNGDKTFSDVTEASGSMFEARKGHRGSAFADFDGDGRVDIVVSALSGKAELWRNTSDAGHWITLRLRGTASNRDGIGASIRIDDQHNLMNTAVGYASSSGLGVHFGLGKQAEIPEIEIVWPGGKKQVLTKVSADQILEVVEPKN
jgi:hypothetical protein